MAEQIDEGIHIISSPAPVPGMGTLDVNFYAVVGTQKRMLIDTGSPVDAEKNIAALSKIIDPKSIDYIFVTHFDADHYGAMKALLELAPNARLVGNIGNMYKGTLFMGLSPERFAVVWPGQPIDLGGRMLTVEPAFVEDAFTWWLFDDKTRTYFSSDAFGAVQFGPPARYADEIPADAFIGGFTLWHQMNFSTLPALDATRFKEAVAQLAKRDIKNIASAHGPIIRKDFGTVFETMARLPSLGLPAVPQLPPIFDLVRGE